MQIDHYLIFISLLLSLTNSCQDSHGEKSAAEDKKIIDTLSFEQVEKVLIEEQQAEIYKIEEKAVVFFMIDRQEAKKLARELGDSYRWETDALFNNFIKQTHDFRNLLRKHNIQTGLIHNKRIQIILNNGNSIYFDRVKEDQILGEILTDGEKEPLIKYGMYRNKELAELIQEFFEIQSLGYAPPDSLELPVKEVVEADSVKSEEPKK